MSKLRSMVSPTTQQLVWSKRILLVLGLLPVGTLVFGVIADTLGANPVEAVTRGLGEWTLRLLWVTLAITPLRRLTGWNWLLRFRRMLGLYAFFYATLHLLSYVWADQFFDWPAIWHDIVKRPFITVGFASFLIMVPLASTSTHGMIKRLGGRRWQSLHRWVYASAILGALHYWWLVKKDVTEPAIYAAILAVLLGARLFWRWQESRHAGVVAL